MGRGAGSSSASPVSPSVAKLNHAYDDWQKDDDLRTLEKAHELKHHPTKHAALKKHAAKKMASLRRVVGKK